MCLTDRSSKVTRGSRAVTVESDAPELQLTGPYLSVRQQAYFDSVSCLRITDLRHFSSLAIFDGQKWAKKWVLRTHVYSTRTLVEYTSHRGIFATSSTLHACVSHVSCARLSFYCLHHCFPQCLKPSTGGAFGTNSMAVAACRVVQTSTINAGSLLT
jgi:hypothetical protein